MGAYDSNDSCLITLVPNKCHFIYARRYNKDGAGTLITDQLPNSLHFFFFFSEFDKLGL